MNRVLIAAPVVAGAIALGACGDAATDMDVIPTPVVPGRLVAMLPADFADRPSVTFVCEYDAHVDTELDIVKRVGFQGTNEPVEVGEKVIGLPLDALAPGQTGFPSIHVYWEGGELHSGCAPESWTMTPVPPPE